MLASNPHSVATPVVAVSFVIAFTRKTAVDSRNTVYYAIVNRNPPLQPVDRKPQP
jgi:hypothetical protein